MAVLVVTEPVGTEVGFTPETRNLLPVNVMFDMVTPKAELNVTFHEVMLVVAEIVDTVHLIDPCTS